jgi:hypothetical protein
MVVISNPKKNIGSNSPKKPVGFEKGAAISAKNKKESTRLYLLLAISIRLFARFLDISNFYCI